MNDDELDRLIARANPYSDDTVRRLPTGKAESDLLEAVISTQTPTPEVTPLRTSRPPVRRRVVVLVAAAATVAVALTGVFFPKGGNPAAPVSAYGAELRAATDATPRLVLDDPGWKIGDVPAFGPDEGQIEFVSGEQELEADWRPVERYPSWEDKSRQGSPVELLGQTGKLYLSGEPSDFTIVLPPKGRYFLTIRADLGSEAAYRSLVAKLKTVDTDAWLDAMPDTIVKQSDAPRVVDEMLTGVPVPGGFDRERLLKVLVLARYHFGVMVTGEVACGWIGQWIAAKQSGDTVKLKEATAALAGSRSWKVLQDMQADGGWSDVLWQTGDTVGRGGSPANGWSTLGCAER
ncbi:hypothetical protein [Kribbella sp. NPDC051770]|uniref:hypothetical protein n=1 Tax=Kribbella sp. NPDC051770 TaxID=3155413 RepID=UPI003427F899